MEKYTLLEIVQDVLSSTESDNVSDISETQEAIDVVKVARSVYNEIASEEDWPHLKKVIHLTALGDASRPNFMQVPTNVAEVLEIRYNTTESSDTDTEIGKCAYLDSHDFLDLVYQRNTSDSEVTSYNTSDGIPIFTYTDRGPSYYTSFDDEIVVFDAYNSDEDSTLQESKSIAKVIALPTWTASNTFKPDLPARMFPAYLAKVRVFAHKYFKQQDLDIDKEDAFRGLNRAKIKKAVSNPVKTKNYGR